MISYRVLPKFVIPVLLLLASCTNEQNYAVCVRSILTLEAYKLGEYGHDVQVDTTVVSGVWLYLFDENNEFIERIESGLGTRTLDYPNPLLTIVALGYTDGANRQFPVLNKGDQLQDGEIILGQDPSNPGFSESPGDIFIQKLTIDNRMGFKSESVVKMYAVTSRVRIVAHNMKEHTQLYDDNYSVVVRETFNSVSFDGTFHGDLVSYRKTGIMDDANLTFTIPEFSIFPSVPGYDFAVDIYHEDTLILSVTHDHLGKSFMALPNKLLNIEVFFGKDITIHIFV